MTLHFMEQGTAEWYDIRAGRMTASVASKLVTASGREGTQYKKYIGTMLAEQMDWQMPEYMADSYWMKRGKRMEAEARRWMGFSLFDLGETSPIQEVGFISMDANHGFSPDGIIINKRPAGSVVIPLEIKVPKPSTHVLWLADLNRGVIPREHLPQCHYALAVTGAPYMYFCSYHPQCPSPVIKLERNDMTKLMVDMMHKYDDALRKTRESLQGILQSAEVGIIVSEKGLSNLATSGGDE